MNTLHRKQAKLRRPRLIAAMTLLSFGPWIGVSHADTPVAPPLSGVSVSVSLDQGSVDVKSTQGPLGLYREQAAKPAAQDFDAFKQQMTDGVRKEKEAFAKYKEQITREFVGYVESVTLKPGTELAISGNTAVERKASAQGNPAQDFMKRWRGEGDSPAGATPQR